MIYGAAPVFVLNFEIKLFSEMVLTLTNFICKSRLDHRDRHNDSFSCRNWKSSKYYDGIRTFIKVNIILQRCIWSIWCNRMFSDVCSYFRTSGSYISNSYISNFMYYMLQDIYNAGNASNFQFCISYISIIANFIYKIILEW